MKKIKFVILIILAIVVLTVGFYFGYPYVSTKIKNVTDPITQEDIYEEVDNAFLGDSEKTSYQLYGAEETKTYGTFTKVFEGEKVYMKVETTVPASVLSNHNDENKFHVMIKDLDSEDGTPYKIGELKKDGDKYASKSASSKETFKRYRLYVIDGFESGVDLEQAILKTEVIE